MFILIFITLKYGVGIIIEAERFLVLLPNICDNSFEVILVDSRGLFEAETNHSTRNTHPNVPNAKNERGQPDKKGILHNSAVPHIDKAIPT